MKQGWAVWSWFVPIVLLWFPKKLANDISRATTRWNHGSKLRPTPLRWWWGLYLASLLVSRLDTTSISDVSNEGLRETAGVTALNAAVLIAFLFVNLWFINNVTKEMSRRQAADPAFTGTAETGIGGEVPRDHTN